MNSIKLERLNGRFVEELNTILMLEAKNPILKNVIVTAVSITNDFSYAKVYFTCMDLDQKEVLDALEESKGFLRTQLASRVEIRHTPELNFEYDESLEYAQRIEDKIKEIHEQDGTPTMEEQGLNPEETKQEEVVEENSVDYEEE